MISKRDYLWGGFSVFIPVFAGCLDSEGEEVSVSAFNLQSQSHVIDIVVRKNNGETVVEGSAKVKESESEEFGSSEPDGKAEFTATAELDGETEINRTFTAGGATGIVSLQARIARDGTFEFELGQE
jgi:hypothetical protein